MTSRHEKSLTMFSIAFMVVVFVPGNPETQTVSRSFPKLCVALQRNFGTDAACRAGRRYVFGLVGRERVFTRDTVLDSFPAIRRRLPNREVNRSPSTSRIAPGRRQVRCGDNPRVTPNCWLLRSRSTTRSCAGCSCRRIRRATRTSLESYSY